MPGLTFSTPDEVLGTHNLFNKAFFAGAFAEHFEGEGPKVIARVVLLPRVLGVNAWSRHLPSGGRENDYRDAEAIGHRT